MAEEEVVTVRRLTRWQRIGVAALLLFGALLAGGVIFILSGIYNIGAARDHWSFTNFAITVLRDRSIAVAASGITVPDLDDPDLYRLGAEHYRGGCGTCHGEAGQPLNPIYRNMLPHPPDLSGAFADYHARELFWIVSNGLKFTGMPAWPGEKRDDEVWAMVAHLAQLHEQAGIRPASPPDRQPIADELSGAGTLPLENCVRCHGDADQAPVSALVPRLHGLPAPYLRRALEAYREQSRASGIMAPVAHAMSAAEIGRLSAYYAGLPAAPVPGNAPAALLERGRQVAEHGVPEDDVPACTSCHNGADPQVPPLTSQSARYMSTQLALWRETNYRNRPPYGSLMALIGRRLSESDAAAVSAWYARQPRAAGAAP